MLSMKTKITCPNWREVAQFYQAHFGFHLVEEWDEPGDKGIILSLSPAREVLLELYDGSAKALDGLSLQFRVDDVDAFADSLDPSIGREGPKNRPWGARYLYLVDPAGVGVIVYSGGW